MGSDDLISRQRAIDAIMGQPPEPHYPSWYAEQIRTLPAAQPDNRLEKIADIVEGTIDHLDRDDAMDMLYQIKEGLK